MKKYNTPEIKLDIFTTEEIASLLDLFTLSGDLSDENIEKGKLSFDGLE